MAKKTTTAGRKASVSAVSLGKSKTATASTSKAMKRAGHGGGRAAAPAVEKQALRLTTGRVTASTATDRPVRAAKSDTATDPSADVLAKAEASIAAAIESLNNQMNAAMTTFTELAVTQRGRGEVSIRTAPLDRATATFQRLIGEVLDDHLAEMLPTLVALRSEMADKARGQDHPGASDPTFFRRAAEMLDQVLAGAKVSQYNARPGETFDPLIHLAVGETHRDDLADGAVAELLQPGFRTIRGKVIAAAKVKVNRR